MATKINSKAILADSTDFSVNGVNGELKALSSVAARANAAALTAESARAAAAELAIQADVDANELDGDTDRAAIRTEMAAADAVVSAAYAAADASALAASIVREDAIQADVDANELDGDNDRALIRTEMASADASALAASLVREAAIQSDVDANELDGDNDRALIRTEMAAADAVVSAAFAAADAAALVASDAADAVVSAAFAAADASALAASIVREDAIQADVDANELDGDNDRALIRTEFAAADTSLAAAYAAADASALAASLVREAAIQSDVDANQIASEAADAVLTTNLAAEFTRASGAEANLATDLASEATDRAAADLTLQGNIDALATSAQAANDALFLQMGTFVAPRKMTLMFGDGTGPDSDEMGVNFFGNGAEPWNARMTVDAGQGWGADRDFYLSRMILSVSGLVYSESFNHDNEGVPSRTAYADLAASAAYAFADGGDYIVNLDGSIKYATELDNGVDRLQFVF